jgi:hypothetical protein
MHVTDIGAPRRHDHSVCCVMRIPNHSADRMKARTDYARPADLLYWRIDSGMNTARMIPTQMSV